MAFKFPFTNYHELNLTWVLDQLKKLFEESAENVTVIENYNGRLTAVETELPLVADTAQGAAQSAAAAASLAQQAKSTADTAQENAIQAQGAAGQARQEAQAAQRAADAATQAAQQAQSVAQNFDGRITEAQNNASEALEASRSFENRVQAAITTANNAAQTATNAQGIATRADQNAALALDTLNAQRSELERIGAEQVEFITEETESGKTEIENLAQSVLDSIPSDYTALSNLVDKKAPVIINSASGAVASFNDGADNMKIQKLAVNIEPVQAGSGDPSPVNVRPISGHTGAEMTRTGKNLLSRANYAGGNRIIENDDGSITLREVGYNGVYFEIKLNPGTYTYSDEVISGAGINRIYSNSLLLIKCNQSNGKNIGSFTITDEAVVQFVKAESTASTIANFQLELGSIASDYDTYTSNQISVTFPSAAGTVYGGTLTLNPDRTGTLVVDTAFVDFGALTWAYSGGYFRSSALINTIKVPVSTNVLGKYWNSMYKQIPWANAGDFAYSVNTTNGQIAVKDSRYPDISSFVAAATGVQFVYELVSPQIYQLTAEQVSGILTTLYGTNNIWADTGDVEVEYPADTKLYIDGKLAELQATILENI